METRRIDVLLGLGVVLPLAAVGAALVSQHYFDMQPCPWCVLQRLIYIVIGVLALLGAVLSATPRRVVVGLAFLVALSGIASALWQQLRAVNENSCDLSFAEKGAHARSAFGVEQIPMGACVEIELIAEVS